MEIGFAFVRTWLQLEHSYLWCPGTEKGIAVSTRLEGLMQSNKRQSYEVQRM